MVSALIFALVASVVLLQAAGYHTRTPTKEANIDELVDGTFAEIQRLINNAGRLIKESLENDFKETVKLQRSIGVAGDFDDFELRAEELDRYFVGRVNHILDRTYLLLDRVIDRTEQKIEDKVRGRSTLQHVEVTLDVMHRMVWDTEDFSSDVVFKAKPEFFKITRRAHEEARRAHEESLRRGCHKTEAQRQFEEALRRGNDRAIELVNKNGNKIMDEIKKVTSQLRIHSKFLLYAGHEAEGRLN